MRAQTVLAQTHTPNPVEDLGLNVESKDCINEGTYLIASRLHTQPTQPFQLIYGSSLV